MKPSTPIYLLVSSAAIVVLAGCGHSTHTPANSDADASINPLDPHVMTAEQTATTAMQTILSWNPTTDASATDAFLRAKPMLTGQLLDTANLTTTAPSGVRPDPRWAGWKAEHAVLSATCVKTSSAPDPMGNRVIDLACTQHVLTPAALVSTLPGDVWRTTLTHTADGWRLSAYQYLQPASQ